jgi:DNA-binding CsgD family transcriptional regulator
MKNILQALLKTNQTRPATKREREVAGHLASGLTNQQTADLLGISIKTVEKHRDHLHKKIGLRNTADLTRWALANELVKNEWLPAEPHKY